MSIDTKLPIETSNPRKLPALLSHEDLSLFRNFLYDVHRQRGVLVDFGLAEVGVTSIT